MEGAFKSKNLRKETMLEIEKYIKKHVGRKVLLTFTFSPSPTLHGPRIPPQLGLHSTYIAGPHQTAIHYTVLV